MADIDKNGPKDLKDDALEDVSGGYTIPHNGPDFSSTPGPGRLSLLTHPIFVYSKCGITVKENRATGNYTFTYQGKKITRTDADAIVENSGLFKKNQ